MLLLLLPTALQAISLVITDVAFSLHLSNQNGKYIVYTKGGDNYSLYRYPSETVSDISYDGNYTINNRSVNRIAYHGIVTPPLWLQRWLLKPINSKPFQLCYDFETERITLKVVVGLLAVLFLTSHGRTISTTVKTLGEDLLQSKIGRRLSRRGSPVAGSQTTYTPVEKEASAWLSESPAALYKTPTISRSEEIS